MAKALNAKNREIGRASLEVKLEADQAQYIKYHFPPEMDSRLVDKYVIDVKK